MYKCPNCGGEMEFLPADGKIKCEFCGSVFSPEEDMSKTRKSAVEHDGFEENSGKIFTCSQCGASLYTTEETGVTFCSYCGSQAFLESRMKGDDNILPDLIIPFSISKKQCEEIYKNKIKSAWFLPKEMKADAVVDKFRGIYMPCWVYSGQVNADGNYTSITTTRSGAYDVIDTYKVTVGAQGTYGGFVRDASASFPDGIMREIEPFSLNKSKPFSDTYMTGFYADIGNVPPAAYHDEIYSELDTNIKNDMVKNPQIKRQKISSGDIGTRTNVNAKITDVRKGFLPVWFLSNKNQRTGLMSYAVVNGENGKIHSDLPLDFKKYLLVSMAIAIPAFLLLMGIQWFLAQHFSIKPGLLLVLVMLISGVMMFISTRMVREAYIQEHGLDDVGLQYLSHNGAPFRGGDPSLRSASQNEKTARKINRTVFGLICFIGIPVLGAFLTYFLNTNLVIWGFIFGIVLFVITSVGGNSGSNAGRPFSPQRRRIRLPAGIVLRSMLFPLIGVILGLGVLIAAPAHDLYYYGAVILCCLLMILAVLDFVRINNRLSLRRPVQLEKRGGDEDE